MTVSSSTNADIDAVAALLKRAERVLFITGAGISADSGLPTYRGIGGLYHERLTAEGLTIEEALSGEMMAQRPDISWRYIGEIESNCRGAKPSAAHLRIADLEAEKPGVWVLTQNVDGLHRMAGSEKVIQIHGTVHHLRCTECPHQRSVHDFAGLDLPPACPVCGGVLRPDIVLFGEMLPQKGLDQLTHVLESGVDLIVSIGTTSVFPYISGPVWWAQQNRIPSVEINPGDTEVSDIVDYRLRMGAADAMTQLWARMHELP